MPKIYYTLGPASLDLTKEMIEAGADGVRQTFSYGTPELQLERAQAIRDVAQTLGKEISILADLEGGGSRIGDITNADGERSFELAAFEEVALVHETELSVTDAEKAIPIPSQQVFSVLGVGDRLVIGDGGAELEVITIGAEARARNLFDAVIEGRRGLVVQNGKFDPVCLTEKDIADLEHIAAHSEYDKVALSFVGSAKDVEKAREILSAHGSTAKLVAKIETKAGVESIEEIAAAADEIMVARGDLALYAPWTEMPKYIEQIVVACKKANKPFMMATQIAEGMLRGNSLMRAELTDLWHWKQAGMASVLL